MEVATQTPYMVAMADRLQNSNKHQKKQVKYHLIPPKHLLEHDQNVS